VIDVAVSERGDTAVDEYPHVRLNRKKVMPHNTTIDV